MFAEYMVASHPNILQALLLGPQKVPPQFWETLNPKPNIPLYNSYIPPISPLNGTPNFGKPSYSGSFSIPPDDTWV